MLRNTEEIVTVDELKALLERAVRPRAYVGYETSGKVHLGHMLTANKLLDLQKSGFDVVVLLADLHAFLNEKGSLEEVRKIADYNRDCFMALGLDPERTEFVYGTDYQLKPDYMLKILQMARNTTLNRAKRSMDEVSRSAENPMVSQMIYPLMQAIDIADLKIDLAVGGIDQRKIHMLAREELPRLGLPAPVCMHAPDPRSQRREDVVLQGQQHCRGRAGGGCGEEDQERLLPGQSRGEQSRAGHMQVPCLPPDRSWHDGEATGEVRRGCALRELRGAGGGLRERGHASQDLKKACADCMNEILAPVREKMGKVIKTNL